MKTREKLIVSIIFKIINFFIYDHKKRTHYLNKIFTNFYFSENISMRKNISFYGKGKLIIGKNSFINEECFLDFSSEIIIGENVAIGMRTIILSSSHFIGKNKRCGVVKRKRTEIGNNVWIGAGAIIYPGIKIDDGCIISAGEIVRENLEKNKILRNGEIMDINFNKIKG